MVVDVGGGGGVLRVLSTSYLLGIITTQPTHKLRAYPVHSVRSGKDD